MLKLTEDFSLFWQEACLEAVPCLGAGQDLSGNEISAGTDATASGRIVVFENDAS